MSSRLHAVGACGWVGGGGGVLQVYVYAYAGFHQQQP